PRLESDTFPGRVPPRGQCASLPPPGGGEGWAGLWFGEGDMRIRVTSSAWLRRNIGLLALAPALIHVGPAAAQAVVPAAKHYHKDKTFHLPIKIDEGSRGDIREVQLYVKFGGSEWQRRDVAPPSQQSFKFNVLADGEYWFTLVTVNSRGYPS